MTFGERLINTRKEAGYNTRKEFAEKLEIPETTLRNYENNKREPGHKFLKEVSSILNVSIDYLLCQTNDKTIQSEKIISHSIKTKAIPIVGTVACGNPIYADENIQEYITVNASDNVDFALYAEGDSMNNCKIDDGDTIYIRKQNVVDDGDIALVLVDDTATIKRFYDYPDKVILKPDSRNPHHKDLEYDKSEHTIVIQGKVIFIKTFVR